jgi:small-conductance mechanosensitive channel
MRWIIILFTFLSFGLFAQEHLLDESDEVEAVAADTATIENQIEMAAGTAVNEWIPRNVFIRLGTSLAIIGATILIMRLIAYLFRRLCNNIETHGEVLFKPIIIKKFQLLGTNQILKAVLFLLMIARYFVYVIVGYLTLLTIFALFEQTKGIAARLLGYIIRPLKNTGLAIVDYIPNLIAIIITFILTHYVIRALKFFTSQIERKKLVLPGFYPDWAQPTFNILRVLVYAFTLIIIYPLLPNSESDIFKGVSVFMGILFSLGSSSVIGNLVAGIVVTYMRPFKLGDRIKIGDVVGFVVEKSATVTRLRTHKNEYVTFPNSTILTSSITNYNLSSTDKYDGGLILYTSITFGYHTPWQTVHALLISAALKTKYVQHNPTPFVLQTNLDDFYACYEINVYTKEVAKVPAIYSELNKNIQDEFIAAGLDMTVTHFRTNMPWNEPIAPEKAEGEKKEREEKGEMHC